MSSNWYTNLKSGLDQPLLNKQSFPNGQFKIPGYVLLCCLVHCYKFGGGIMVFVREDIPSWVLSLNKSIESLFIELNFHKKKWLHCCTYNPNIQYFKSPWLIKKKLRFIFCRIWTFYYCGRFFTEVTQTSMKVFCDSYEFENLIKDARCYKNLKNPSFWQIILIVFKIQV